ncbi:MAG: addiction module protein [Candidatus Saccharimonas sp.]|nr:addiction module protein [Planctomycetaceae bacterium]
MTTIERLRREAFQLPIHERTALARDLLASLEAETADEDAESELVALVRERSRQLDSGEAVALDWRESLALVRAQLAARLAGSP